MSKKLLTLLMAVALITAMLSTNALAFSTGHTAIYPNNTNIDVLIAADNTYSGDITNFVAELKASLGDMGSISDTVNISKVQSNVSLANFDDWYVYDHYYNPDYPTDGSVPADWDDFSGRHPYFYYKESSYEYPLSAIQSAELILHDTLWPAYTAAVADLSTFNEEDYLYAYAAEQYPFEILSDAEKSALEPQLVAGLNTRMNTSFTTLNDYYAYIVGNESSYNMYYFLPAYGELIYPSLSSTEKNSIINDFYYERYITSYTWSNAYYTISDYIANNFSESDFFVTDVTSTGNMDWVFLRDKHIYTSIDNENSADITFIGYSSPAYKDFMIYPMESDSQKTVNFDIDASKVYTHTLEGAGFLINSGIDESGYIKGYILFYRFASQSSGTVYLLEINDNVLASSLHNESSNSILNYATTLYSESFQFNSASMKKNIDITISSTSVTCVDTDYIDQNTMSAEGATLFGETKTVEDIGVYGYGPITSYTSHGCSEISAFTFKNLKMEYESSSVTALRNATYVDEAKKVYILLTDMPETDTSSESYYELITRLYRDQIFYVTGGGAAIVNAIGGNGLDISGSADEVADVAAYLESVYNETTTWADPQMQYPFTDLLPVAIFDILDTEGSQVITIDQRHIGSDSFTLTFGNLEKSVSLAPDADALEYHFSVYDPDNQLMTLEGDGNNEITIDSSSAYGTYTFELIVSHGFITPEDTRELTSFAATRQLTVLYDTTPPAVTRVGNTATPHTGSSITLNLSDSESGVTAYAVGKATGSNEPVYSDEILLAQPTALEQITLSTDNTEFTLYVKVYDACGNEQIWSVSHVATTVQSQASFFITASAGSGGSISPTGITHITAYSSKQISITPDDGYEILDVLVDGNSVGAMTEYTFSSITSNHTIEAIFTLHGLVCPCDTFTDLDITQWYHEGIDYVILAGLFDGMSEDTFEPTSTMTRAMLVTVLWRLENEPNSSFSDLFLDIINGTWYTEAVAWAAENNIVEGYNSESFGPSDPITREQMAAILYRYANYKGYSVTSTADLSEFTDAGNTSDWALTAVKWAVAEGLLTGVGETSLDPTGNASRAQVATLLMRFVQNIVK